MTIVNNVAKLKDYPYRMLAPEVVEIFRNIDVSSKNAPKDIELPIKLLECYCDITQQPLTLSGLDIYALNRIVAGFVGAMNDSRFIPNQRASKATILRNVMKGFTDITVNHLQRAPIVWTPGHFVLAEAYWERNISNFSPERLQYWSGWEIKSKKGKPVYLNLSNLWNSHGAEFTTMYFEHWKVFLEKMERPGYSEINIMTNFLADNKDEWPPSIFQHPIHIRKFFENFMVFFFSGVIRKKLNLDSQIKAWGRFVSNVEDAFIESGAWAKPFGGGLPKPVARNAHLKTTRVFKTELGVEVHQKLLTNVPLHITDEQAIEILFSEISNDLAIVCKWARAQIFALRKRQKARELAIKFLNVETMEDESSLEGKALERRIFSVFSSHGFNPDINHITRNMGWGISNKYIGHVLGLPCGRELYPFMCLLVSIHPEITTTFLIEFELYDKFGHQTGFKKTNSGYQLTGFKKRAGNPEMKIQLKPRAAALVRMIIELSQPLRDYLKANQNDSWRKLFLIIPKGYCNPKPASLPQWSIKAFEVYPAQFNKLELQFSPFTHLRGKNLAEFLSRVSLGTIRASSGVIVFLETKSVEAMAKALGHSRYHPDLLSHYLPKILLEFFQSRWIRIFQKGIICHAMRNSPRLLDATQFSSMAELNEFLKNHALSDIPECEDNHFGSPEEPPKINSQVMIRIDVGILTTLLSLQLAVQLAGENSGICGSARYWADVAFLVKRSIESGNDLKLKNHLIAAMEHSNPQKMEGLIYATY